MQKSSMPDFNEISQEMSKDRVEINLSIKYVIEPLFHNTHGCSMPFYKEIPYRIL